MFLVPRIENRFQKVHEAVRAANILWRTASRPVHEGRILPIWLPVAELLDDHFMAPVVAVVVGIKESLHAAANRSAQPQTLRLVDRRLVVEFAKRGIAVAPAVDIEFPEVSKGPPMVIWIASCKASSVVDSGISMRRHIFGSSSCSSMRSRAIRSLTAAFRQPSLRPAGHRTGAGPRQPPPLAAWDRCVRGCRHKGRPGHHGMTRCVSQDSMRKSEGRDHRRM